MTEWSRETWREISIETLSEFQEYSRIGGAAMEPAQVTQKAVADIGKLASGMDRAEVALDALRDSVLTPKQVEQLQALLKQVSQTQAAPSAAQSPTAGRIETVDGHQAVVGKIAVNGQQLETLLTDGPSVPLFLLSTREEIRAHEDCLPEYAARLGYRMATRAETQAYVDSLVTKLEDKSINSAECKAFNTLGAERVRDDEGWVRGRDGRVCENDWIDHHCRYGSVGRESGLYALFVRASAESK